MSAVESSSISELYELPTISSVTAVLHCLESAAPVTPSSHSILTSPATDQPEIPDYLTDVRMAGSFIKHTNGRVCYWHDAGKWMDFDGNRWETDTPGGAFKYIKGFLDPMYHAALEMPHGSRKAELLKSLLSRESTSGQKNMLDAAAVQPAACITTALLDHDPWLFNCLNGTVDLRTGILRAHRHDDFMTKIAHVKFDPFAKCPTFDKFMSRIMGGDPALISYMQRWIGYCMTGSVAEQVMQIRYGTGANGKSVLSNVEGALFGDYSKAAGGHLLLQQPNGGSDLTTLAELAKLRGVRLARISEIDEGSRLAEAQLKNITGGDTVTCRTLYGKPFEYEPSFKISLLCNHTPQVRGTDYAIWRRIHKVPFSVTIPQDEQDPNLTDKLRSELPGILNWALAGCLEWQKTGLKPPAAVLEATAEYQNSEDMFASWLKDCCTMGDQHSAKASYLLDSFITYSGWKSTSHKKFGTMLKEHGFEKVKSSGIVWQGLGLLGSLNPISDKSHGNNLHSELPKKASDSLNDPKKGDLSDSL